MPDTAWPIRYAGKVPRVGGAVASAPVSSSDWSTRDEFRGLTPGSAGVWFAAATVSVDVTPGTVGEVRLRSTVNDTGVTWTTDPIQFSGPLIGETTKWLRVREEAAAVEEHQMEVQLRRVSGSGSVTLLDSVAGWVSSPPNEDVQPTFQTNYVTQNVSYGDGPQTVANPAQGTGRSVIFVTVAPGPGYDNGTATWTDPMGLTPIVDYIASDIVSFPFVHRVRIWTAVEDGAADWTFGFTNGSGSSQERDQTCMVIELDRPVPGLQVFGPEADASTATPYPGATLGPNYIGMMLSTVQNSDELTAGPTSPSAWPERFNNTDDDPARWRRLALHTLILPAGAVTPGNSTWAAGTSAHVNFLIAVPPGSS